MIIASMDSIQKNIGEFISKKLEKKPDPEISLVSRLVEDSMTVSSKSALFAGS